MAKAKKKDSKKDKKHKRGAGSHAAPRRALACLDETPAAALAAFEHAFVRLESNASSHLEQIVNDTIEGARAVTDELHDVLAHTKQESGDTLEEMLSSRQQLRTQLARILKETERLEASVEQARMSTGIAIVELDVLGNEQLREMTARYEQALDELLAGTTDRAGAIAKTVEEHTAKVDTDLDALRARTAHELDAILSEAVEHQVAIDAARAAADTAVADLDARGKHQLDDMAARSEQAISELSQNAETKLNQSAQRLDDWADERRGAVEAVVAEAAERLTNSQRELDASGREILEDGAKHLAERLAAVDRDAAELQEITEITRTKMEGVLSAVDAVAAEATETLANSQREFDASGREIREEGAKHLAERLAAVDRDAAELEEISRARMEATLSAVDEQSVETLNRVSERTDEVLAQTAAHEQAAQAARDRCDALADSMDGQAELVRTRVAEADAALALIRDQVVAAEDLVARLTAEAEQARQIGDSLPDDAARDAEFESGWSSDPSAGGTELVDWAASFEPESDGASSQGHVDDALTYRAPFEENFFSRIAAELDSEEGELGFPSRHEHDEPLPLPASADAQPMPVWAEPVSTGHLASARTATATVPTSVQAPLGALTACFEALEQGAGGPSIRIEVSPTESGTSGDASTMRLVTYDPEGWWEYGDVPVTVDAQCGATAVVATAELHDAMTSIERFTRGSEASILIDENITIGNYLMLARELDEVPAIPDERRTIERIELNAANRPGVVLETQAGRIFVPPALLAHLRRRQAVNTELVMVGGEPCLSAQIGNPSADRGLTIIARLRELGDDDDPGVSERRGEQGSEVAQLVVALSATSTSEELERILKVGVGFARRKAAAHPALPEELIHDLIHEGTEVMRAAAAANPSIGAADADGATADESSVVRAAVAANPSIPQHGLEQLASDEVPSVRAQVVSNPAAPTELLARLAEDPDAFVRATVARQKNVPVEQLVVLARDPELMVCAAVASNPMCPPEILNELASVVPEPVLANPNASPSLLVAGSTVDASRLRASVASNPATPAKGLRKLARDRDPEVLRALAEHPAAPAGVRRRARRALATPPPQD